jgi:diguanylate cyclase (GGDEF)-like protein/PAS domain S-box-containing protein
MTKPRAPDMDSVPPPPAAPALRRRAELRSERNRILNPLPAAAILTADAQRELRHELQVHQIELELQNEDLREAKAEVEVSKARYFDLYDLAPVGYCIANETGLVVEANLTLAALLGVTRGALAKQPLSRFINRDDQDIYYRMRQQLLAYPTDLPANRPASCELRMIKADGTDFWALLSATVAPNPSGQLAGNRAVLRLTVSDITARKQTDARLLLAASVFGHTHEGILITDPQGTVLEVNDAFTRVSGYSREEVLGRNPRMLHSGLQNPDFYAAMWRGLTEQGHWSGELWNRRKDGQLFAELLTISAVRDGHGKTQNYVALFSDVSAIKAHQKQLDHLAHFDTLTSLPNRALLADRLLQGLAQTIRRGDTLAVAYLDLDGFKSINDRYGHGVGDQLLISLAANMKQVMRDGDTLARIGGDEFVAMLTDLPNQQACVPLLTRLLEAAAQPLTVGDLVVQVSASLGVTFYPQAHEIDAGQLLRQADQAMYQAKLAGKNRYHIFDSDLDSSARVHHEGVERIRLAMERHEFVLHYQPKVNMRSGRLIGAEALLRWNHPERGLLAPGAFLPVIEDHPLAVAIGEWVIDTALHQIALWRTAGLDLPVSVNIGARQLQQGDFFERLKAILASHPQVQPSHLELEILETSALNDMAQVSKVIEACERISIPFALDDFGTGYSSLTYLKRLRVATLKIDQSFVHDMLQDPDDLAILHSVIGLALAFKREVIAEGVETIAHGTALLELGCELAQGYGIARPMPGNAMPAWATAWATAPNPFV